MGNVKEIENLYKDMGEVFQQLKRLVLLCNYFYEDFEKMFW